MGEGARRPPGRTTADARRAASGTRCLRGGAVASVGTAARAGQPPGRAVGEGARPPSVRSPEMPERPWEGPHLPGTVRQSTQRGGHWGAWRWLPRHAGAGGGHRGEGPRGRVVLAAATRQCGRGPPWREGHLGAWCADVKLNGGGRRTKITEENRRKKLKNGYNGLFIFLSTTRSCFAKRGNKTAPAPLKELFVELKPNKMA